MAVQHPIPTDFQPQVEACGSRLASIHNNQDTAPANTHKWLEFLINRTISDTRFRVQALRFIDVLPSLENDQVLAEHLQEYFADLELPALAEWGLKHSETPWLTRIAAPTVRYTLRGLARKFMGGSKLHHALTSVSRLRHQNMNFTLDLLGEATISEPESQAYQQQYLQMLESLSEPVTNWTHNALLDTSHGETSPRLNLSIKLSSLYSQISSAAEQDSIDAIKQRLLPILYSARKHRAFITIDMEQYDLKHIVLGCFRQIIMHEDFIDWPHIGIAMQAYLKDTYDDIEQLVSLSQQRGTPFTVRLVRGAYWDYETVIAEQNNWPCPVWQNKNDTDYNYEKCLFLLLSSQPDIHTAIATHNPRSLAFAMALIDQLGLSHDQYEFQMLYGMAEPLKHSLRQLEYRLRIYVPFGETLPGMAYLVRRLLENSSGQSLLDSGFGAQKNALNESSFLAPKPTTESLRLTPDNKKVFRNTPLLRFIHQQQCAEFQSVLKQTESRLGQSYPLLINGREIFSETIIDSVNPANPEQIIGKVSSASHSHADQALHSARSAFSLWSTTPVQQRADYLRIVAKQLAKQRMEFAALQVFEAGKSWYEADADICEAIDFLNYYAQQAERLCAGELISVNGELNSLYYRPRGVSLVIPPWNFPLAILCGMLSASIVCGNTSILKPSSLTPVIAAEFIKLWQKANLPDGVINFLPGSGKTIGEYLARKPDIDIIAFTGSLQVGSQLLQFGSQVQPGQQHIKNVIAEMGGKNAIIIDSDADLDEAVTGCLQSAFGFQGQKCSAASRIIVVKHIYRRFVKRLLEAADSLTIGSPVDPHNFMGPVIDQDAYNKILQSINNAKKTATQHKLNSAKIHSHGYYIQPCIFTDVDPQSPLAQEEIFGPVLAVIEAEDFKQAVSLANNTRYALTGGLYSRQPSHLEYAKQYFNVGNLYLNRKITGALVGRQPFGGHKMSGAGNKAGSEEYLMQFMHACCVTENTLRRGFAPKHDAPDGPG